MHAIGIDIGGTKIAAGLVDDEGNLSGSIRIDTPREARAIEDAVVELVEGLRSGTEVAAVGVAAPGFIDREASVVYFTPNLAWRGEPLRDVLEARLDASVTIENDANAAGWAEYRFGAGRGRRDVVMLTLGTGVGGAIVIDGELYRGGHGAAAELGHIRLVTGGELCGCGQRGCLEQYASGRALQRIAGEIAAADPAGALAEARSADGIVHGADFARLVHAGDTGALDALSQVAVNLAHGCGTLSAMLDPELFIIGGGLSQLGDALMRTVRETYVDTMPAAGSRPVAEFTVAELENDAGVVGVADLARRAAERVDETREGGMLG